jgi:hypothetical protein
MYSYTIVLFAHITRSFMRIRSCKVANTCMTYGWDMSSALIFGWGVGGRAGKPWNGCSRQEKNGGDWETRSITFHTSHNTEDIAILTHTASLQTFRVYCKKGVGTWTHFNTTVTAVDPHIQCTKYEFHEITFSRTSSTYYFRENSLPISKIFLIFAKTANVLALSRAFSPNT